MAKHPISKRDDDYEVSRRALIKWTLAAGAALGVSRAKIGEILEKTAGKETARAATALTSTRSVHIVAGNGGLSWFQLMWPQPGVAMANNATFSYHLPGQAKLVAGTDNPLYLGPDSPWQTLPAQKQVTCFMTGASRAHVNNANTTGDINGTNLYSIASSLQSSTSSVVPLITIGGLAATGAPGGVAPTNVGAAADVVGLFNSAASRAGGLLANSTDATWYGVQYASFAQLNRAASTSVQQGSYATASSAAKLLGTNLASKLSITAADNTRYGLTSSTRSTVTAIGQALIVTAKAFGLGLTNAVCIPAFLDDPHGAFAAMDTVVVAPQLKGVLDAFMLDLQNTTDSVSSEVLSDITTITVNGDTPKDITHDNGNWDDGTPTGANLLYVYGAGNLKTGWFGSVDVNTATVTGYDDSANPTTYSATNTAKYATGSVAYAIARRDERAINAFTNGFTIGGVFGVPLQS
ncbi:MAG TPA: hypothetical protein VH143_21150 [Kofleriaceae bacterium]|jgi:hypothetical protein|nr:hypothetical protein [Kofleriaceae bacterium]